MQRRRFLLAGAGAISTLWFRQALAGPPRHVVFAHGGSCSFCGVGYREVRLVRGLRENPQICSHCVWLCVDILAEGRSQRPRALSCNFCNAPAHAARQLIAGPTISICDATIRDAAGLLGLPARPP